MKLMTLHRYTGWLRTAGQPEEKGKQFDSTTGRGPFSTPIGVGRVIKGTHAHTYTHIPAVLHGHG
jgi:FKBP-type peptidyl-prolyl cis-trans isomerase